MPVCWRFPSPSASQASHDDKGAADAASKAQYPKTKKPQPTKDQPQVVTGTAQQHVHPVTLHPLQPVPPQMAIRLQVIDHRLNRLPAPQTPPQPARHNAPPLPGQVHRCLPLGMTTVAAVHEHLLDRLARQDPDLGQRSLQRMTVIGILRQGHPAKDESAPVRGRYAYLHAELVPLVGLGMKFVSPSLVRFMSGVLKRIAA